MLQQAKKMPGQIEKGMPGSKAVSLCFIEQSLPRGLESSLFDGLTRIKGGPYHCLTGWLRIGMPGQVEGEIRPFVENLAATGEKEIIFIHPGCYASATVLTKEYEVEVPFRPVHIFEYLLEQMVITTILIRFAAAHPCDLEAWIKEYWSFRRIISKMQNKQMLKRWLSSVRVVFAVWAKVL